MTKNSVFKTVGLVVAGVSCGLLVSFSPDAAAVDGKTYPGSGFCDGRQPADESDLYRTTTYLENEYGGSDTYVACGIVRDDINSASIADAWVRVYNQSSSDAVNCDLWSFAYTGSYGNKEDGTSGNVAGKRVIHFTGGGLSVYDQGYYGILCALDAGDKIYSYRVDEN